MESYNAYVKAVSDLCQTRKSLGRNPNGVARGPLVITFLETLDKKKGENLRTSFADRGKNGLNDICTRKEFQ